MAHILEARTRVAFVLLPEAEMGNSTAFWNRTLASFRRQDIGIPLIITLETVNEQKSDLAGLFAAAWAALTPSLLLETDVSWLLIVGYSEIKWNCTHQEDNNHDDDDCHDADADDDDDACTSVALLSFGVYANQVSQPARRLKDNNPLREWQK
ncbi:GD18925 [Drosophila simulans]|uniref:GD18925 n=1 Tax=Drosophila simulans TaxID=7240 RepID=B4R0L6_DROSI|nr:GD18925 [Drosophila simulans]